MGKRHFIDNGSSSIQQHKIYLLGAANSAKGLRKKEAVAEGFDPDAAARSFLQHIVHIEKNWGSGITAAPPRYAQPGSCLLFYSLRLPFLFFDLFRQLTFGLALVLSCRLFQLPFCCRFHIDRTLACGRGGLCGRSFRIGQFLFQFLLHIPRLRLTLSEADGRHPDEADQADRKDSKRMAHLSTPLFTHIDQS